MSKKSAENEMLRRQAKAQNEFEKKIQRLLPGQQHQERFFRNEEVRRDCLHGVRTRIPRKRTRPVD